MLHRRGTRLLDWYGTRDQWLLEREQRFRATAANWSPSTAAPGSTTTDNSDVATFSKTLSLAGTVTVDATRYIGGISFVNSSSFGYTLQTGTLYLNSGGVIQTLAADGAHNDIISSPIVIDGNGGQRQLHGRARCPPATC